MAKPPPEPRLGGFKIQGPVRGAPSAKNNDRLWRCTNDEARGTVFVKQGAPPRQASTWPVPAAASAVGRPWSCTLPPELGLTVCGYLDAPSLARLEISHGLIIRTPARRCLTARGPGEMLYGEGVRATVYGSAPIPAIPSASTAATSSCGALP